LDIERKQSMITVKNEPSRICAVKRVLRSALLAAALVASSPLVVQAQATSSVRIPIKKEKPRPAPVVLHDTVTILRVDTVLVVRVDTLFRTDTLRDSCSRAIVPIPIPIPLPGDRGHTAVTEAATQSVTVTPEPATFLLVGSGLAGLTLISYFRRSK
jgi:hypothetical protein